MTDRTRKSGVPRPRQAAILLVLTAATALCAGCLGGQGTSSARPSPRTQPLDRPATQRSLEAPIPTLVAVLPEVFDRLEWAELRRVDETTALHAAALTPDGRTVHLRAQSSADGGSRVQVRAGHFGDPAVEQRFLKALEREIRKQKREAEKKE